MDVACDTGTITGMRHCAIVPLLLLSTAAIAAENGRLNKAKEELHDHGGSRPSSSSSSANTGTTSTFSSSRDGGGSTGVGLLFDVLFSPESAESTQFQRSSAAGPGLGLDDGHLAYPYADGAPGYLVHREARFTPAPDAAPEVKADAEKLPRMYYGGGAVYGEYGDFGDGLRRYGVGARVGFSYVFAQTDWQRFIEHLSDGSTDTLTLGMLGVGLAIPRGTSLRVNLGVGLSYAHDSLGLESGWYAELGADAFPIRPLVISVDVRGGWVRADQYSPQTFIGTGRATAGVIWDRFEVYAGWQATWIESVTLDGPIGGLRVWF